MSFEELDDRKMLILKAIVDDYIKSMEPVGSRTIAKKYDMGLSSSTIRNEMADLEEMGLLSQPHTSAGRIPSEKGYRVYVDHLLNPNEAELDELNKMKSFLENKIVELSQMIKVATQVISRITQYTSFSVSQKPRTTGIKALQVVPIERRKALIVVVLDNNIIRNKLINVDETLSPESLVRLSNIINEKLAGHAAERISILLINEIVEKAGIERAVILPIIDGIIDCLKQSEEAEVYTEGASNLLIHPEFNNVSKAKSLLELISNDNIILDMLNECAKAGGLIVKIGSENNIDQINECSIITATYRINNIELGTIGVLGPTRMDYSKVITSLEYIRKKMNQDVLILLGDSS